MTTEDVTLAALTKFVQFVEYGSGLFFGMCLLWFPYRVFAHQYIPLSVGEEFIDTVSFGGLTISKQSIGAAEFAEGFDGVDGILG